MKYVVAHRGLSSKAPPLQSWLICVRLIGSKCLKCELISDPEVSEATDFYLQNV